LNPGLVNQVFMIIWQMRGYEKGVALNEIARKMHPIAAYPAPPTCSLFPVASIAATGDGKE
jgi:hypothetical protein